MEKKDEKKPPPMSPRGVGQDAMSLSMEAAAEPRPVRPGAVSVARSAPKGKPSRNTSTANGQEMRTSLENNSAAVEPPRESAQSEPTSTVTTTASLASSSSTTARDRGPVRASRRADAKTAIREEMDALKSKGPIQPGAMSVVPGPSGSTSSAPAPAPTTAFDGKAALRAEVDALRNKSRGQSQAPGVVSVSGSGSSATASTTVPGRDSKDVIRQEMEALRGKQDMNRPGALSVAPNDARTERASRKGRRTSDNVEMTTENRAEMKSAAMAKASAPLGSPIPEMAEGSYEQRQRQSLNKDIDFGAQMKANQKASEGAVVQEMSKSNTELTKQTGGDQFQPTIVSEDGLVAAQVIDEDLLEKEYQERMMLNVVAADAVSEKELKQAERGRCTRLVICFVIFIGIVVGVSVPLAKKEGEIITNAPSEAPTLAPDEDFLADLLFDLSGDSLFNETTSQGRAYKWLLEEDETIDDIREYGDDALRERYAAVVWYYSTGGEFWSSQVGFLNETSICEWYDAQTDTGIVCDEELQSALSLKFSNMNLTGTIPPEIAAFSNLVSVLSFRGQLGGTIPSEISTLANLRAFQVYAHRMTGSLPRDLSKMTDVVAFNVYDNQLTGQVETIFESYLSLAFLSLGRNDFTGSLPKLRPNQPIGFFLNDNCRFTGTLPEHLYTQRNLQVINLDQNNLSGKLDSRFAGLTDLAVLDVANNGLTGSIPEKLSGMERLATLVLDGNALTGTIPAELADLEDLVDLELSNNALQGSVPEGFGSFRSLKTMKLDSNALEGSLPPSIAEIATLEILDISNTSITSGVEESFCSAPVLNTSVTADCGGATPVIPCSCCTSCCDGSECEINLFGVCEARASGFLVQEEKGPTCECSPDGVTLACDNTCQTCNVERTVCSQSIDYGYTFNATTGDPLTYQSTIQYVVGRDETILYTIDYTDIGTECSVAVNGLKCAQCTTTVCQSGILGIRVDCQNIEADPRQIDICEDEGEPGYLEAFQWTDIALRDPESCEIELDLATT